MLVNWVPGLTEALNPTITPLAARLALSNFDRRNGKDDDEKNTV